MRDIVADERCVAVYWLCTGTYEYEFAGVAATGCKFGACVMIFCYFKGMNKIAKNVAAEMAIDSLLAIGACDKRSLSASPFSAIFG